jgi:hypothetical protein
MTTATYTDPHPPPPTEPKLRASQAAHLFPPGRMGKPRLPETIARYVRDGIDVGGVTVRLEGGADTAGSWWTTAAAVERFLGRLTAARMGAGAALPARPSRASAEFQRLRNAARPGRVK